MTSTSGAVEPAPGGADLGWVRCSVQAGPTDRGAWLDLARDAERRGLEALYVADHPGSGPAPFVALAAAAAVTERIRLGTCVVNAGLWEPVRLATEVATLDVVSGGRALLGIGAGHTPQEWTAVGSAFPSPGERVDRLIEVVDATRALLAGDVVTRRGQHVTLDGATLGDLRPAQGALPLMVGGNGPRVLRCAAQTADIVGLTGLGRTLDDGHRHEVDWSPSALARTAEQIDEQAAGRRPEREALVQVVELTDDAPAAAERLAPHVPGATAEDLLDTPFAWIGTADEVRDRLRDHRDLYGITRYVVRPRVLAAVTEVLDLPGD